MIRYLKKTIRIIFMIYYSAYLKIKKNIIVAISVRISKNTYLEGGNKINSNVSIADSHIGYATYIGPNSLLDKVEVGRYCSIASNVKVIAATHPTRIFVSTHPAFFSLLKQSGFTFAANQLYDEFLYYKENVYLSIGNDVWIGPDVILIGGIKIGDGSIILAGSVVTKDVEPYSIVGGVPAKFIRHRFSQSQIENLLVIKWWNWDLSKIKNHCHLFNNIDNFLFEIKTNL